jgi:hypothetical protein
MPRLAKILLVLAMLVVAACARLQLPTLEVAPAPPTDVELFAKGVDQLGRGNRPEAFAQLARDYPASPWLARSRMIEALSAKVQEVEKEVQQSAKRQTTCEEERARLQADVRSLDAYTAKLKALLAESGITGPEAPAR